MTTFTAEPTVMARLDRPRSDEVTRLGVVADPHVSTRAEGTSKLFERTREQFAATVADAADRDLDALLSVGDLTKDGEPWNYAAVEEVLAAHRESLPPVYAVPGNHDVPKAGDDHDTPPVAEFAREYLPDDVSVGPDPEGDGYPFRARVGGVDLVGLNSAGTADRLAGTHEGRVDADRRAWLRETLADAETPVVLVHHNLPATYDQVRAHRDAVEPEMFVPPTTREADALVETLAAGGAELVLTGHLHMPATSVSYPTDADGDADVDADADADVDADAGADAGGGADGPTDADAAAGPGGVREVMAPTTCSFPQAYLLVTVGPEGTTVRFVPVADRAGLRAAHAKRSTDSTTSRGLTAMAAVRLAGFPLVEEF